MLLPAQTNGPIAVGGEAVVGLANGASSAGARRRAWAGARVAAWSDAIRRGLNVVAAITGLVIALPLMIVIGILIRLTSPGPILYTQPRVGVDRRWRGAANDRSRRVIDHGGKLFRIYKFRTMYVVLDGSDQRWAQPEDPRVTPLGRVLRRYRLDELPQLINVLMGDMNLVGPRPEQPRIFADLRERIPEYERRQRVLPGITGWAQVNQPYDSCMDDVRRKVMYDLEYIDRCSPLEDLKIILYTLPAVVVKRGGW
jgi:lipopolysaccharide/colanic/teichoic acid biosynthesis glycosyltransferase